MKLNKMAQEDGGLIVRTARKQYRCAGSDTAIRQHAPGCAETIWPGEQYLECLWETPAYQSGSRHTETCALDFFCDWVSA